MRYSWKTSVFVALISFFSFYLGVQETAAQWSPQAQPNTMQKGNAGAMKMNPSQSSSMKGGALLGAPGQTGNAMQPKSNSPASKETFLIVEVGKDLQVVSKSGLKDLKKRIEDDFKRATQDYQNAKKDKNNKGAKIEKPEKKTVKEIKSGIKTQEKAQEELQKLQEERNKKKSS